MLTWQWALLHVADSPLFDKSPDGEQRVETILAVTGCIRLMHAVHKACEYSDGGPALSWPSVYTYMQRYHHAFLVSRKLCLFDQWYPQLKAKQMELLHKGAAPHLHDDLQRQLISAARGNLNTSWLDELRSTMSRPHAQHPPAPGRTNPNPAPSVPKACAYCLGDYQTSQHPAEEPTTQPCPKCRQPHALVGKLATPCPAANLLAFLDGLRVVRRSFKPSGTREAADRRYLALGCRGDSAPPTLTWTIPPGHAAGWAKGYQGQAGIDDNICGVYTPGLRVNTAALLMSPHVPSDMKAQLLEGAPLLWTGRPPRSRKNNYKSCFDNNNAAGVNFDRIIALGFCEGPLHYLPWIVNLIALSAQATSAMPRLSGNGPTGLFYACASCMVGLRARHQRLCITFLNLGCLRRAAAAALTCDYRVSGSGAVFYTDLSAVRVLSNAELGCRYIRLRVDVDKNVGARHECFAYIPDHVPCLAVRPVDLLEDYLRVFRPPSGSRLLAAP
eukprot:jgi/Tetstr1/448905/TSEL_036131.t1